MTPGKFHMKISVDEFSVITTFKPAISDFMAKYSHCLKITILSRHMTPKRSDSRRSRGRWGPPLLLAPGSQEKIGFKQTNIGIYTVIYDIPSGYD